MKTLRSFTSIFYMAETEASVFSHVLDTSAPVECKMYMEIGSNEHPLDGSGGNFEYKLVVDSVPVQPSPVIVAIGEQTRAILNIPAFIVPAGGFVYIGLKSPNAADTAVDVTTVLYDVSPLQPYTSGTALLVEPTTRWGDNFVLFITPDVSNTFTLELFEGSWPEDMEGKWLWISGFPGDSWDPCWCQVVARQSANEIVVQGAIGVEYFTAGLAVLGGGVLPASAPVAGEVYNKLYENRTSFHANTSGLATSAELSAFDAKFTFAGGRLLVLAQPRTGAIGEENVFRFGVSVEQAEDFVQGEQVDYEDTQILDAVQRVTTYTNALVATQWQLRTAVISSGQGGVPEITFASSDEGVATVDAGGFAFYVGDGTCIITCESQETETSPRYVVEVEITNTHIGGQTTQSTTLIPDDFDASKHVLILYNAEVQNSVDLKDYYLTNRLGMATANTLGLTGLPDSHVITAADAVTKIYDPVETWMLDNPSKPLRYVIVMRGLPSKRDASPRGGVAWPLSTLPYDRGIPERNGKLYQNCFNSLLQPYFAALFPGSLLVCHMDCGTYAQTTAYIDKLKTFAELNGGAGYNAADGSISASSVGYGAMTWVLDDTCTDGYWGVMYQRRTALLIEGISEEDIMYQPDSDDPYVSASDVTSWASWGVHTPFPASWAISEITLTGDSNWFQLMSIESFNGIMGGSQGDPTEFFAPTAFGGTNYDKTPVFFVGHTQEPTLGGINTKLYQSLWAKGWTGLEAATKSSLETTPFIAVGDPLVRR